MINPRMKAVIDIATSSIVLSASSMEKFPKFEQLLKQLKLLELSRSVYVKSLSYFNEWSLACCRTLFISLATRDFTNETKSTFIDFGMDRELSKGKVRLKDEQLAEEEGEKVSIVPQLLQFDAGPRCCRSLRVF